MKRNIREKKQHLSLPAHPSVPYHEAPAAIACDVCGADCEAESWLVNGEEDVCPKCYKEGKMKGGERQIMGEPAPAAPVPAEKKKSKASGPATKKRKSR